ncbi:hypothetical protein ACTFIZ_000208 [Dictyostelium cf. discoideum]
MKLSMQTKLSQLSEGLTELDQILAQPEVTNDMNIVSSLKTDLEAAQLMLTDSEMKEFAEEEVQAARARMEQIELELQTWLLPQDPNDERNIYLEIRAGTGGYESALFAADLLRMYTRYAHVGKRR